VVAAIALTAIPVAACVAILRYHLYDVDVVINRAVVYDTLTLLLAAAYGATTIVLGTRAGEGRLLPVDTCPQQRIHSAYAHSPGAAAGSGPHTALVSWLSTMIITYDPR
jgi:hypothetical protein